ncbi:MAG: hypothetical protein RR263_00485 [Oscillospiraceae bacterium]
MFPCQRIMLGQAKRNGSEYKFECECVGFVADVSVEDDKPFPPLAQMKFIEDMCNRKCPGLNPPKQKN